MVNVFSPLWPGKAGWSLASQRWLEVNDLGRLVNRYGRMQWHPLQYLPGKIPWMEEPGGLQSMGS